MSAGGERIRPSGRRIFALGALWAAISGAALLAPGCYGRNCEGGVAVFGPDAGEGEMVDDVHWQSGRQDGTWLWFPRQRYYIFNIPELGGRTPLDVIPYIAATPEQKNGGNHTLAAGNVAELFNVSPNHFDIKNDTCSDYYLRVVITVPPLPPEIPSTADTADGGAEAGIIDAGVDDGATDAGDAD